MDFLMRAANKNNLEIKLIWMDTITKPCRNSERISRIESAVQLLPMAQMLQQTHRCFLLESFHHL